MVKLALDRCKIIEDVGMIELQIVKDRRSRAVMDELGAFIEEGSVVFVGLDDEQFAAGMAGRHRKIERHAADEEAGRTSCRFEDPGEHCRDAGLAVRAGDRQHVTADEHVLRQPLRAGHVALATVEDRFHERVAARHNIADHPQIGRDRDLFLAETFGELDAQRHHLVAHRRIDVGVAAGNAVARSAGNGRDAAHERAANAEDMKVLGHRRAAILVDDL